MANDAAGCPWQSSCKSPRTLQKCKLLITKQLTFGAVLGEHKLSSPSTRLKVNHLCIRYLCIKSVRGDLQEGHSYASRCHLSFCSSTKMPILCSGGLVCALSAGQQPVGNQKKTACNQKQTRRQTKHTAGNQPPPLATRNQPPGIKKGLPEPRDGVPADLYANTVIADYCSLSPFMEMRNSWLLIVFSSLFFINSIASTLFISAR